MPFFHQEKRPVLLHSFSSTFPDYFFFYFANIAYNEAAVARPDCPGHTRRARMALQEVLFTLFCSVCLESAQSADLYVAYSGSQEYVGIHKFGENRVRPPNHDKGICKELDWFSGSLSS